jgi:hypothetical protein
MSVWGFLLAAVGPLALRVIATLGLSVLTFAGVDTALQSLIASAQSNWSQVPSDILGLCAVARIPECIGLICGAMTARVTLWVAASATRWITKAT